MRLSYVLRIAWKALMARKTRSLVTIGGIVIGVGAIVFLVSLGYGLQRLVTQEVAELDALRLIEATSEKASVLKITDETLENFRGLGNVSAALPLVNIAGKAKVNSATTDAVFFGTTNEYLKLNSIRPAGRIFTDSPPPDGVKEILANASLLKVLGLPPGEAAIGKKIDLDFVLTNSVAPDLAETETRAAGTYTIVGTLGDASSPALYLPLSELAAHGVKNYSQVSIQATHEGDVADLRTKVEALGYKTGSVIDTITQINQVFAIFRIILAAVGAIALVIAALGMFNTLTVSLLERTREIGFMKALGTRNRDVYRIFIAEAVLIAITGGVVGTLAGYYFGELVNIILNILARRTSNPAVDIFMTPIAFAGWVLLFSVLVGLATGLFPARRASRINPLDALRYE